MNREELKNKLKGRFFTVVFTKKNGEKRKLHGRLGVKKYLKGGAKSFSDADKNLLTVFDMGIKQYRSFNLDSVESLKFGGKELWK